VDQDSRKVDGLDRVSVVSVKELVQEKLIQYLRTQRMSPQDKLPSEGALAYSLGVSRNAVREALRSLEAMGIIEARTGAGWYVRTPSLDAVAQALIVGLELNGYEFAGLNRLRLCLESGFFEEAVQALTPDDLDRLQYLADEMARQARAGGAPFEPDYQFHQTLYSRIGNPAFDRLMVVLWKAYMSINSRKPSSELSMPDIEEHRKVVAALRAGDVERARHHLLTSLRGVERIITELSDATDSPSTASTTADCQCPNPTFS
jgi:DNA-binding FadR family transcriptional regulator